MTITHKRLLEVVHYDPETGIFTWKPRPRVRAGKRIGSLTSHGYLEGCILGRRYYLHRLAWFYMTGEWPKQIDHRNRKRTDDRFGNLREATGSQNAVNSDHWRNKTGYRGVTMRLRSNGRPKYIVQIRTSRARTHLGVFDTAEEAHAAYVRAAHATYGEFAEHL